MQTNGKFAIWQVQCKVGSIGSRDVVDRELGVAQALKSNVILFVTVGAVGRAAREAAETYMKTTGLNIIFLESEDLDAVGAGGSLAQPMDRQFAWVAKTRAPE